MQACKNANMQLFKYDNLQVFRYAGLSAHILVVCDLLSGLMQAYDCHNRRTEEVVNNLRQFFAQYGLASSIRADSGPAFHKEFARKIGKLGYRLFALWHITQPLTDAQSEG